MRIDGKTKEDEYGFKITFQQRKQKHELDVGPSFSKAHNYIYIYIIHMTASKIRP